MVGSVNGKRAIDVPGPGLQPTRHVSHRHLSTREILLQLVGKILHF